MANEGELLTINEAGDAWVDATPDEAQYGYALQNVNITARSVGMDRSVVTTNGTNLVTLEISGPIDDLGVPITVRSPVTQTGTSYKEQYIAILPGSTITTRNFSFFKPYDADNNEILWDTANNCYVTFFSGIKRRVLNWVINRRVDYTNTSAVQIVVAKLTVPNQGANDYSRRNLFSSRGFVRWCDLPREMLWNRITHQIDSPGGSPGDIAFTFNDDLVSYDDTTNRVYIHVEKTDWTWISFAAHTTGITGISIATSGGATGNLVSCTQHTIYIHNGISNSIQTSFSAPGSLGMRGIAVDKNDNLISCVAESGGKIYIHNGLTSTITSSFVIDFGAFGPIEVDADNNLVIQNSNNVFQCIGISPNVRSKTVFPHPGITFNGVAVDSFNNLATCSDSEDKIYFHGTEKIVDPPY